MATPSPSLSAAVAVRQTARLSCTTCRKQKRKCSRTLPSCSLCTKNRRSCDYPPEAFDELDLDNNQSSTGVKLPPNGFPSVFFLDNYLFSKDNYTVPKAITGIPHEYLWLVEDDAQVTIAIDSYFNHFHPYLPFLSKIRFERTLNASHVSRSPCDFALLLASIQLITQRGLSSSTASSIRYESTKRMASTLESRGILSVTLLQAHLLIALFEICQAVYPNAYLTIGHCAQLGHAMGLHDPRNAPQLGQARARLSASWTELEEQRRTWWAVRILDRYVSIGSAGASSRPFPCEDARPSDALPQEESSWERGEPAPTPSLAVSVIASDRDGSGPGATAPFARTCQAADLLSRVIQHLARQKTTGIVREDLAHWYRDAMTLHNLLTAFYTALTWDFRTQMPIISTATIDGQIDSDQQHQHQQERWSFSLYSAMGLCFSALIMLYDAHTCAVADHPDGMGLAEQLEIQGVALQGLIRVCTDVHEFSGAIRQVVAPADEDRITTTTAATSPLITDCLYAAARCYLWYWNDTNKLELLQPLKELVGTLEQLGAYWRVGSEYLGILNGQGLQEALSSGVVGLDGSDSSHGTFPWSPLS
ncbi:fungal-specific transcription factor domain-containing protein [Xylariales sp. PMI_506]|nr:fungal-specific transcription factor domain-containing protein [Xylariales sp. PMI_506]